MVADYYSDIQVSKVNVSKIQGLGQLHVHLSRTQSRMLYRHKKDSGSSRRRSTADPLTVLDGGEAQIADVSEWSLGVNMG